MGPAHSCAQQVKRLINQHRKVCRKYHDIHQMTSLSDRRISVDKSTPTAPKKQKYSAGERRNSKHLHTINDNQIFIETELKRTEPTKNQKKNVGHAAQLLLYIVYY